MTVREFYTFDEMAELVALAREMNALHDVCVRLAAAKAVAAVAEGAAERRRAAARVRDLRAVRTTAVESLAVTLRVRELAALTGLKPSQISRTLRNAATPVPHHGRGGPQHRR